MSQLNSLLNGIEDHTDEDLIDLLPDYFDNRRTDLENLKSYLANDDIDGVAAIAHKILGTAKSYGLERLDIIVNEMEKYSKYEPNLRELVAIVDALEQYIQTKSY